MANEITVTTGLAVSNGELSVTVTSTSKRFDQTTARGGGPGTVDIGTTEETVSFGDISPGYMLIKNLDTTNYVEMGFSAGVYGVRILASGGSALFYMNPGATMYAKANTSACKVQIIALNQ